MPCILEERKKRKEALHTSLSGGEIRKASLSLHTCQEFTLPQNMSTYRFPLKTEFNEGHKYCTISIKQPLTKEGNLTHSQNVG